MSVQELQRLHRRYSTLSDRFRSAWAFHQYLESLRKVFADGPRAELASAFHEAYSELKSISERLSGAGAEDLEGPLDAVEGRIGTLSARLLEEDSRVSPETLRQFFQRVKSHGDNLLTQLAKFYVYSTRGGSWPEDRLDKLDFLLTRLAGEAGGDGRYTLIERRRLREISTGLWGLLGADQPSEETVERALEAIRRLRSSASAADGLDRLNEERLVPRFRELKHRLDRYVLYPPILLEVLETNLVLKNLVNRLYSVEERRIVADYQRIFDLERDATLDEELERELRRFRDEVEEFEGRLREDELKLDELARLRGRVHTLASRLGEGSVDAEVGGGPGPGVEPVTLAGLEATVAGRAPAVRGAGSAEAVMRGALERLEAALDAADPDLPPGRAVLGADLYPFALDPRELVAHRRLEEGDGGGAPAERPELERTLIEAAALRTAIAEGAGEIEGARRETGAGAGPPPLARAREVLALAPVYLARLREEQERAVLAGDAAEARALLVVRMRLMKEYSAGWITALEPSTTA